MTKSKPVLTPKPRKTSTDPMVIAVLKSHRERGAFFSWLETHGFAPVEVERSVYVQPELEPRFDALFHELNDEPDAQRGFGLTSLRFETPPEPSRLRGGRG